MSDANGPGSVFGGGLDTQSGAPTYNGDGSGALPAGGLPALDAQAPAPQPQSSAPPAQSTFGSSLTSMLGPHYTPLADPQATALDQSANLLQQRVARANQIVTGPMAWLWADIRAWSRCSKRASMVPKLTEQLTQAFSSKKRPYKPAARKRNRSA